MSDDLKKPDGHKVGYCKPPREHRFKKGERRNPRGRPRKQERSFLPRQLRLDVLTLAEKQIVLNTRGGKKKMPAAEAILEVALARAMSGHLPSIRFLHGLIQVAVHDHTAAHYERGYEALEQLERSIQLAREPISEELLEYLNSMRRYTRSITPVVVAPPPLGTAPNGRKKN